jgi:hypothetical protein
MPGRIPEVKLNCSKQITGKSLPADMKEKQIQQCLRIIDEIEKVRGRNNVNWMDVLRIAFRHAPDETQALMGKINQEDDRISVLLKKLSEGRLESEPCD